MFPGSQSAMSQRAGSPDGFYKGIDSGLGSVPGTHPPNFTAGLIPVVETEGLADQVSRSRRKDGKNPVGLGCLGYFYSNDFGYACPKALCHVVCVAGRPQP